MRALASVLISALVAVNLQPVSSLRGTTTNRNLQTNQTDLCASIIAIALTRDPAASSNQRTLQTKASKVSKFSKAPTPAPTVDESVSVTEYGEQFLCERSTTGEFLPLIGSEDQLVQLRDALNDGVLISAETTIVGLTEEDLESGDSGTPQNNPFTEIDLDSTETSGETAVTLPPGKLHFKPGNNGQHSLQQRALQRNLAVYTGTKKVLFVKVIDANGLAHPDNARTMSDKIFGTYGDDTTMKDQFEACSFGDMKITNQYGFDLGKAEAAPGVIEVTLGISLKSSSRNQIQEAAKRAAEAKIGRSLPGPFAHVMYSLEGCYNECGWAAYAGVNTWFSVYQGNNYKFPAVSLHEIGHNLNLAHSGGDDGLTYTDHSCLMGNPWFRDDVSSMCYNPAKSFQLSQQGSWYSDRIVTWNSGSSQPNLLVQNLVGVADYGNNPNNFPVIVKLESGSSTDLFVGFNRARGINSATKDGRDMVTVIEQGRDGIGYATSVLVSSLSAGQSYTAKNWQGSGKNLVIRVRNIVKGEAPWYAEVEFNFNNADSSTPAPTPPPTPKPSSAPTPIPTPAPSKPPVTSAPTRRCGDSVCVADENEENCPADCVNAEFSTYIDNIGAKGANGTMWSIQAMRSVEINSIYTFLRSNPVDLVQVYTRQGSYNGFETSEAGWNLVFDDIILLNGQNQVTELSFSTKVSIAAGQTQSFYVYSPSNLAYRSEEVQEGDLVKSDDSFRFYAGVAVAFGKFGDGIVYSPRVFSGVISYNAISRGSDTATPTSSPTQPVPTSLPTTSPFSLCGNGVCESSEHSGVCATDCSNIAYYGADSGNKGADGIMFSIKALRDIIVTSFDVYGVITGSSLFQVYTKVDSWQGLEAAQSNWTLFYSNPSLEQKGRFTLTNLGVIANGVLIPAGSVQSFYLYTPTKLMYDVGVGSSPYSSNDALEFYEGAGITGGLFAGGDASQNVVSSRVFAGTIRFDVVEGSSMSFSPTSKPTTSPSASPTTSVPTKQPVGALLCGDMICDLSEDALSCPSDCKNVVLDANDVGAKGAEGVMFSVKALRNITIQNFHFFGSDVGTALVQVYTRRGPYRGYEASMDGWSLVFNATVDQLGRNNATSLGALDEEVVILANEMQSFLLFSPNKVMYKGGTNEGALFASDGGLEVYEGIGLDGALFNGTVYSPRVFRGLITYDIIGALSSYTCGNDICEAYETSTNCPSDCLDLSLETTDTAAKGAAGAMFSIKSLRGINVTSLDFFGASVNSNLVQVYTRSGSYQGHQASSDGWELVYDNSSVDINGRFESTPLETLSREINIPSNSIQSFYIYSPSKVMYRGGTSDTSEGTLYASNDAVEFYEGIGVDGFFAGNTYSPRVWRGTIRFKGV